MLYRILNTLFGWDYIQWRNSADYGVARVLVDGDGNPFYFRYKLTKCIDTIKNKEDVIWLTCPSMKYLKGENN